MNVNIHDAKEYVTDFFAKAGTPVTIESADWGEDETVVNVVFIFNDQECPRGDMLMSVWYEQRPNDGTYLYGEW